MSSAATHRRRRRGMVATAVLVAVSAALILGALLLRFVLPEPRPADSDEARRALDTHLTDVVATLPAGDVLSDDTSFTVSECVSDAGAQTVAAARVVELLPSFDRLAWPSALEDRFSEDEGWRVTVATLETRDQLRVSLVGRDLSIVTALLLAHGDRTRLTLTSSSGCTAR